MSSGCACSGGMPAGQQGRHANRQVSIDSARQAIEQVTRQAIEQVTRQASEQVSKADKRAAASARLAIKKKAAVKAVMMSL